VPEAVAAGDACAAAAGRCHPGRCAVHVPGAAGPADGRELADVLVFADIALQLLLDASSGVSGSPGYLPLDGLADRRAVVYQATGMISVQLG
jgi:hypothetical protein